MGLKPATVALAGLLAAFAAGAPPVLAQPPVLSPSQAAFVQAESRRIEDYFVRQVAHIVDIEPARVRRAMPDERRITVAVSRLIAALELDLGQPLGEAQIDAIVAADRARLAALQRLREGAAAR